MKKDILIEFAIRFGFIILAGLLVLFFSIFANGFAGPAKLYLFFNLWL